VRMSGYYSGYVADRMAAVVSVQFMALNLLHANLTASASSEISVDPRCDRQHCHLHSGLSDRAGRRNVYQWKWARQIQLTLLADN